MIVISSSTGGETTSFVGRRSTGSTVVATGSRGLASETRIEEAREWFDHFDSHYCFYFCCCWLVLLLRGCVSMEVTPPPPPHMDKTANVLLFIYLSELQTDHYQLFTSKSKQIYLASFWNFDGLLRGSIFLSICRCCFPFLTPDA